MVTVSSAFISSRRERIIFSVLSASGCAFKAAAWVDVLRAVLVALGKTDLDNTDVARDHSFRCIAIRPNPSAARSPYYACGVNGFNIQYPIFEVRDPLQHPLTNFGIKGVLVTLCFLVPLFDLKLLRQTRGNLCRSFKSAAPVRSPCHFVLQLPSRFRKPVDDRLIFMPVRKTQAGVRCSASLPA